jgi:hypothetical protein
MAAQVDGKKALTIRVPVALHREARVLSVLRGESLQDVLVESLREWVKRAKEEVR